VASESSYPSQHEKEVSSGNTSGTRTYCFIPVCDLSARRPSLKYLSQLVTTYPVIPYHQYNSSQSAVVFYQESFLYLTS